MATKYGNWVWEGVSTEVKPSKPVAGDGHIFKELDTGESYAMVAGVWEYINLGLAFVKATKSGRAVTDATGDWSITFATPFIDNQYSIALSCEDPGGPPAHTAYFHTRTAAGFSVKTRNLAGAPNGNVSFSWLATRDYNP